MGMAPAGAAIRFPEQNDASHFLSKNSLETRHRYGDPQMLSVYSVCDAHKATIVKALSKTQEYWLLLAEQFTSPTNYSLV